MGEDLNESLGFDEDFKKFYISCEVISGVDEQSETFKLPMITRFE